MQINLRGIWQRISQRGQLKSSPPLWPILNLEERDRMPYDRQTVVEQALDEFLTLRAQLEMRTVDYVLSLRPMLSAEQQQRLIGLSQQGRRWRGGRS